MYILRLLAFSACLVAFLADSDHVHESKASDDHVHETNASEHAHETKDSGEEMNEFDREHEAAGILSLTDDTFDAAISSHAAVLVKFYAPWCLHSREMAPEYVKAALILKEKNSKVRLARVDASLEKKLAEKYKITGHPTLKYFKGESVIDYSGGRTSETIASWVEMKLLPATTRLSTVDEADKFVASENVTILGLFSGAAAAENSKILEDTAFTQLGNIPCGLTDSEELMSHFGISKDTILLFQNIDKERLEFQGPFDVDSIATFVKKNKLPLVVEFTHANAPDIFGGNITKHALLFVSKSHEEAFKAAVSEFRIPAEKFKGRVIFIYVDTDVDENEKILQFFGIQKDDPPSMRLIALDMNMSKFKPTFDAITSAAATEFVQDVLDGKVDPHLPSEEIPEDWDKKPVKVLVTKNFDQVAMDQTKTVFVMFYAPWCDHSKMLAPVWEQLAEEYANNDTIVIAKMDSSANELPDMKILSFPTLKLFPANSNSVIDYHGLDRSLESLKAFLNAGGKKPSEEATDKKEEQKEDSKEEVKEAGTTDEKANESSEKAKEEL